VYGTTFGGLTSLLGESQGKTDADGCLLADTGGGVIFLVEWQEIPAGPTQHAKDHKPQRVPSREGAVCEVWDNGDSEHLRYFNRIDTEGSPLFVSEKQWIGDDQRGTTWDNWREFAPVEGEEGRV
jgi:hypothetical protein